MKKRFSLLSAAVMMALAFMTGAFFQPTPARTGEQSDCSGNRWAIHMTGEYEILTDPEYKVDGSPVMAPGERGWRFTVVAR